MQEVAVKTHLIIKGIHSEYDINWCGKMKDADPIWINEKPLFILIRSTKRVEMNTFDIHEIERIGKLITEPKGRKAVATDRTYIYLKEVNGNDRLMGVITHKRIKTFAPMYDKVGWCE